MCLFVCVNVCVFVCLCVCVCVRAGTGEVVGRGHCEIVDGAVAEEASVDLLPPYYRSPTACSHDPPAVLAPPGPPCRCVRHCVGLLPCDCLRLCVWLCVCVCVCVCVSVQDWDVLRPWVSGSQLELAELAAAGVYVAGVCVRICVCACVFVSRLLWCRTPSVMPHES